MATRTTTQDSRKRARLLRLLRRNNGGSVAPTTLPHLKASANGVREGGVSGHALRQALIAGIERLQSRREELDRINVFPVADGDTGTNLAFTLGAVLDAVRNERQPNAGLLFQHVADVALDGARGNSGTLFAQFAQGMSESMGGTPRLDLRGLANAAKGGLRLAREALAEPREGTVLSVIAAFAAALEGAADRALRLREGFTQALVRAREALAHTPQQLAVLREAGVVDAGACGFVELLEGIEAQWSSGRRRRTERTVASISDEPLHGVRPRAGAHFTPDSPERFCTECLIAGEALNRHAIKTALTALPLSSLVIAGNTTRVRVHAHTDQPGQLFHACEKFGMVSGHKADDMRAQAKSMASSQRVVIVVDGGADVPPAEAERAGLHWVPVRVSFGARDFVDRVSLTPVEFYALMRSGQHPPPRTSQPPPGDFVRVFEYLTAHRHDVAYVGLSRAVSGTLQAGEVAATRIASDRRIAAIDTRRVSAAQGLLAIDAAEAAAAGFELDAVIARVQVMRERTRLFALIADPSYGVRGGRAPRLAEPLARWLRVRLVVGMNQQGRMSLAGLLGGNERLAERFGEWIARRCRGDSRWRINIGHCDDPQGAARLADELRRRLPRLETCWIGEAGTGIGAHAGPGALIVGVQAWLPLAGSTMAEVRRTPPP